MSSGPEDDQPIPLSEAWFNRRANSRIETTEEQLRTILSEVVQEHVAAKITRLETSINRMVDQFEAVHNGEADVAALRVTTDHEAVDLASVGINIPTEDYYIYTYGELADKLQVCSYDVQKVVRVFKLLNNPKYHKLIRTGRKSTVHKWSEETFLRLRKALESTEFTSFPWQN